MNKEGGKPEMSLAAPLSPGVLYQFLCTQPGESGLKIKQPFDKPVLKVRPKATRISEEQRKAWHFHLGEMHQRQVGSAEAERAKQVIDSLMQKEALTSAAGNFLEPVNALMAAEQVRLRNASACVKRWLANERRVLEIAVRAGADDNDAIKKRNALALACRMLEKFRDSDNGEIDTNGLRDQAYAIGKGLSDEELKLMHLARFLLVASKAELADYVGPEVPHIIELCTYAHGRSQEKYRADEKTKSLCADIAAVLRARTDTDEYVVPGSPRTVAQRKNQRGSMPVFAEPSQGSATSSTTTPEKELDGVYTQTDTGEKPQSPRVNAATTTAQEASRRSPSSPSFPQGARSMARDTTDVTSADRQHEIEERAKRKLALSATEGASGRGDRKQVAGGKGKGHVRSASAMPAPTADESKSGKPKKREARHSMKYEAPPFSPAETGGNASSEVKSEGKKRDGDWKKRRQEQVGYRKSQPTPTEMKKYQQQLFPPTLRSSTHLTSSQQNTGSAMAATLNALLDAYGDPTFAGKWETLQGRLGSQLPEAGHAVVAKLLPYWKNVDLRNLDGSDFSGVVLAAGMTRDDRKALIKLRDALLLDSLQGQQAVAAAAFPELLALVIYTIDAHRGLRRQKS